MEELWELGPPPPMPAWLGAPSDRDDYTDAPQQQDDDEEGDDEDADDEAQDPLLPELPQPVATAAALPVTLQMAAAETASGAGASTKPSTAQHAILMPSCFS